VDLKIARGCQSRATEVPVAKFNITVGIDRNSYSERAIFPGGTLVLKGEPVTRVSVPLSMLYV